MNKSKVIYWSSTSIVALVMLYSAYGYMTNEELKGAFVHLGFPDYFRVQLAVAKIIGVLLLILPGVSARLKELAYFGFAITFLSAFIAHASSSDPLSATVAPLVFMTLLTLSFLSFNRLTQQRVSRQR